MKVGKDKGKEEGGKGWRDEDKYSSLNFNGPFPLVDKEWKLLLTDDQSSTSAYIRERGFILHGTV
jgi:hypothetical protein